MKLTEFFIGIILLSCITLFNSCDNSDDANEITTMKVNHYKQSGSSLFLSQFLLVQEGNLAGGNEWNLFYDDIEDFNYELGYVYTLTVEKIWLENPPVDGSSIHYRLIEVVNKVKAPLDEEFEILLARLTDDNGYDSYFEEVDNLSYKLLDGTKIDCQDYCDELSKKMLNKQSITGVFTHSDDGRLLLKALK